MGHTSWRVCNNCSPNISKVASTRLRELKQRFQQVKCKVDYSIKTRWSLPGTWQILHRRDVYICKYKWNPCEWLSLRKSPQAAHSLECIAHNHYVISLKIQIVTLFTCKKEESFPNYCCAPSCQQPLAHWVDACSCKLYQAQKHTKYPKQTYLHLNAQHLKSSFFLIFRNWEWGSKASMNCSVIHLQSNMPQKSQKTKKKWLLYMNSGF